MYALGRMVIFAELFLAFGLLCSSIAMQLERTRQGWSVSPRVRARVRNVLGLEQVSDGLGLSGLHSLQRLVRGLKAWALQPYTPVPRFDISFVTVYRTCLDFLEGQGGVGECR